jgi:hypothetical protein
VVMLVQETKMMFWHVLLLVVKRDWLVINTPHAIKSENRFSYLRPG